ncbi:TetR/AcrR family transcriptional regulator [Nocardia brasiliensis]|uniref:TetR/AcrR family transcriptional regulator n=1 Tax=Nocardia brasiliensis TaxID=37326 RepID=UPI00226BBDA9|nr:TetR/AcrR family transcriptional regulator [Nocardia brasiliensis]
MTNSRNAFGLGSTGGSCAAQVVRTARARQTDNTRRALIRAGRRALAMGQVERVGIANLVRDAGLGTGTFYNYFDSKPQFFEAVVHTVIGEVVQILDTAAAAEPANASAAHLRAIVGLGFSDPDLARIVLNEGFELFENPAIIERLTAPFAAGIEAGAGADRHSAIAVALLWAAALAALQVWQRDPAASTGSLDSFARQLLTVLDLAPES